MSEHEEDLRSAYSEARSVKQAILTMVGNVLTDLQAYEKGLSMLAMGSSSFSNWKISLITLYRFMKPKLIPYQNENKYKEFRNRIEPVMDEIMGNVRDDISYEKQKKVTEYLIQFIDVMGITNLDLESNWEESDL